jgi:pimeloyl-ACP methyl ester carboxylesterase
VGQRGAHAPAYELHADVPVLRAWAEVTAREAPVVLEHVSSFAAGGLWGRAEPGWAEEVSLWTAANPWSGEFRWSRATLAQHGLVDVGMVAFGQMSVAALAEDVEAQLREGPTCLVGHSMGGQVAVLTALRHPDRVAGLVVVDPAYGAEPREMEDAPARLADLRTRGAAAGVDVVDGGFREGRPARLRRSAREQMARTPGSALADLCESMYLTPSSMGATAAAAAVLAEVARLAIPALSLYSTPEAAQVAEGSRGPRAHGS